MSTFGQLAMLVALVGSGYAAFGCMVGTLRDHAPVRRSGTCAAVAAVAALTAVTVILARALLVKDFSFAYVAQHCNRLLPWHYCLSALWVGQAGSLLVWAWMLGVLTLAYGLWPGGRSDRLRHSVLGILMGCCCFLVAVMVFGADPMAPGLSTPHDGSGLSPLLQHPAMLIHPPVVLLGYASWTVPFALALAALLGNRPDAGWVHQARSWALFSWVVLGIGIILGGQWAYEELGWGGYWSWDPVENGSLVPWLTGTALVHVLMVWQYRGGLKKTALLLAIATFALCNFATFLTRSGVFGGLHAFSRSPVGWMFLGLMGALAVAGGLLVALRRRELQAEQTIAGVWSREASVVISVVGLLLLALAVLVGTAVLPASSVLWGRKIVVGAAFYNGVLVPTGLLLMATVAAAPLLCWGKSPSPGQRTWLLIAAIAGAGAAVSAMALGVRSPTALTVAALTAAAVAAMAGALVLDARGGLIAALRAGRRRYAGFLIHLGFVCLAVGVTGSSLGTRRQEVVLGEGHWVQWAGRSVRCARLLQRELPGKLVAEARLDVSEDGVPTASLVPAQHLHLPQNEWTTEVAIHSTWGGDLYAILHGLHGTAGEDGTAQQNVSLTLIENPMMRWIWLGGCVIGVGALLRLWPSRVRRRPPSAVPVSKVPAPKLIRHKRHQTVTSAGYDHQANRD